MIRITAMARLLSLCLCACNPQEELSVSEGRPSLPEIQRGEFIATDYPEDIAEEDVGGVLDSLGAYMDAMLQEDFSVSSFLDIAYHNEVLRFSITEDSREAYVINQENAFLYGWEQNPLRVARQTVRYAANSGHTINNLRLTDEASGVGIKDFLPYLDSAAAIQDGDENIIRYELTEDSAREIIAYCSAMLAENRDTELYKLSDSQIAFAMCERYSEDSLLGFVGFLEKDAGGVYKIRTLIDFNC